MSLDALSPDERRSLIVSIGTHRGSRQLSPVEVGRLLRKAVDGGDSMSDCAAAVHLKSTSQVSRFMALLKLSPDVQHVVDWGTPDDSLSFTSAFELSRLDDADDQRRAVEAVLANRLSSSEVRQLVQAKQRSGKTLDECVAAIIKMRPQVSIRYVFVGAVMNERLRDRLSKMTQQLRDEHLRNALAGELHELKASGHLGVARFTLVGGSEFGDAIKSMRDELESRVNTVLSAGVAP